VNFDFERFSSPAEDRVPVFLLQFHQRVRVFLVEAGEQKRWSIYVGWEAGTYQIVSVSRYFSKASLTWARIDSSCIASIALDTNDV